MKKYWWVSCLKITILVISVDGRIIETAPVARRFVGQPLRNLRVWMEKFGGFRIERLI